MRIEKSTTFNPGRIAYRVVPTIFGRSFANWGPFEYSRTRAVVSWLNNALELKRRYYRIFKRYRRLELRCVSYAEGDRLIRESVGKPECEQWVLAEEEDNNRLIGVVVMLQRRERILA